MSINLKNKYKISKFYSVLFFVFVVISQQFCYAQGEPVIYSHKKTAVTSEGVNVVGVFPVSQVGVDVVLEKNKEPIEVALGLENDSPLPFKLDSICADKIFDGKYMAFTNCPEALSSGEGCEYFFNGNMKPLININSDTYITVSYYQGSTEELKKTNIRPWAAILSLQKIFDFSEPQTLTLKNIFPYAVEVQQVELLDGIYSQTNVDSEILECANCNIIKSDGTCEIIIPAQKDATKYRTLRIEYQESSRQTLQHCYIGLTNSAIVDSDNLKPGKQSSDLGIVNHIYNNLYSYLVPTGIAIVTGGVWYYAHRAVGGIDRLALEAAALEAAFRGGGSGGLRPQPQAMPHENPSFIAPLPPPPVPFTPPMVIRQSSMFQTPLPSRESRTGGVGDYAAEAAAAARRVVPRPPDWSPRKEALERRGQGKSMLGGRKVKFPRQSPTSSPHRSPSSVNASNKQS